jgi:hypothetical protein
LLTGMWKRDWNFNSYLFSVLIVTPPCLNWIFMWKCLVIRIIICFNWHFVIFSWQTKSILLKTIFIDLGNMKWVYCRICFFYSCITFVRWTMHKRNKTAKKTTIPKSTYNRQIDIYNMYTHSSLCVRLTINIFRY